MFILSLGIKWVIWYEIFLSILITIVRLRFLYNILNSFIAKNNSFQHEFKNVGEDKTYNLAGCHCWIKYDCVVWIRTIQLCLLRFCLTFQTVVDIFFHCHLFIQTKITSSLLIRPIYITHELVHMSRPF